MASNDPDVVVNEDTKYCSNCTKHIAVTNFLIHSLHCTKNIQLCNLCKEPYPTKEMDQHMIEYHQIEPCEKCNELMERWQLETHKDLCSRRSSSCQYCTIALSFNLLSEHEEYCGSRTVACVSCKKFIMLKNEKQHFEACKEEQLRKKYGERPRTLSADKESVISKKNIFINPDNSTSNNYGIFANFKNSAVHEEKQPFNVVKKETNVIRGIGRGMKGLNDKEMKALIEKTKDVFVTCYICSQNILRGEVEEHRNNCNGCNHSANRGHCETAASANQHCNYDSKPSCYDEEYNAERMKKRNAFKEPLEPTYEECPICSTKFPSHELNYHITLCSDRKTTCSFCRSEILLLEMEEHLKKCYYNPNTLKKEANYSSAFNEILRQKLYGHEDDDQQLCQSAVENYSPESQYDIKSSNSPSSLERDKEECPVCLSQIPSIRFEYHLKYCSNQQTVCRFCYQSIFRLEEEEHLKKCERIINSSAREDPNYNSGMNRQPSFTDVVRSTFNSTVGTVLSKLTSNDSHEEISPNTQNLACKPSPKQCSLCAKSVHESDLNHLENCLKKSFKCNFCDIIMLPAKFKQHIEEDCENFKKTQWQCARGSGKRKKKGKQTNYYDYFTKSRNINTVQTVKEETIMLPCEFCEVLIPENEIILHESGCRPDLVSFAKKVNEEDLAPCEDNLGATASGVRQKYGSCASPRKYLTSDVLASAPCAQSDGVSSCIKKFPENEFSILYKNNVKETAADPTNKKLQKWTLNSNWDTAPGEYLSSNVSSSGEFEPRFKESEISTSSNSSTDYINSLREQMPKVDNEIKNNDNSHKEKYMPENLENYGSNDTSAVNVDKFLSFLNMDSDDELINTRTSNVNSFSNATSNPLASVIGNWDHRFHQGGTEGVEPKNFNNQNLWTPVEESQHSSNEHNHQFGTSIWSNSSQETSSDSYNKKEYRDRH